MRVVMIGPKNLDWFTAEDMSDDDLLIVGSKPSEKQPAHYKSLTETIVPQRYSSASRTMELEFTACVEQIAPFVAKRDEVRIYCNQEANIELAERLRSHFNIPSHFLADTNRFRDKLLMKRLISDAGLRAPKFVHLPTPATRESVLKAANITGYPLIIKPRASVGSRGVYKVRQASDINRFITDTTEDQTEYEAEEMITGDLYQADFAVQDGQVIFKAVSRYSVPMADLQEGLTLGSIPVEDTDEIYGRMLIYAERCLDAIGKDDGCFHMELFHSVDNEIIFLEVAARVPGLLTVPVYQNRFGVNLYDVEYLIQTGRSAHASAQPRTGHVKRSSFYVVFPNKEGVVERLNSPELAADLKITWNVEVGKSYSPTKTNIENAGVAIVSCADSTALPDMFHFMTEAFVPINYII